MFPCSQSLEQNSFLRGPSSDVCKTFGFALGIISLVSAVILHTQGFSSAAYGSAYFLGGTFVIMGVLSALLALPCKRKPVSETYHEKELQSIESYKDCEIDQEALRKLQEIQFQEQQQAEEAAAQKVQRSYRAWKNRKILLLKVKECARTSRKEQAVHAILESIFSKGQAIIQQKEKELQIAKFKVGLGNLHSIPQAILIVIFSFSRLGDLCRCSLVSKSFKLLSETPSLWVSHAQLRFPESLPLGISGKTSYMQFNENFYKKDYKLFSFYRENDIFQNPLKLIDADIETFQGVYGIDLDEVGTDTWLAREGADPILLTPWVNTLVEDGDFTKLDTIPHGVPHSLTYRDGFKYVIKGLNELILEERETDKLESLQKKRFFNFKTGDAVYTTLTNLEHTKTKSVKHIRKVQSSLTYIPWINVILEVLKERGYIFSIKYSTSFRNVQL